MPLSLNKNLNVGVSAGYFRLSRITFNALNGTAQAYVNLYIDKPAFLAGKQAIDQYAFDLSLDITNSTALMNAIETQLKAQPFLTGAQDA